MSTRDQFGKYLLLKKLTEDPLGETFRAGQVGTSGMDRVVLLRVFNGPGLRGDQLMKGISERKQLLELLRSPNLAEGVDTGEVHGVPYVAWDYVSGKDLRTLMDQAEKQFSPIPTDQALLIAERIALGLGVAHGTRGPDGQRVHHGFLVPHLVLVSNEGDTRLMGFAAAPVLRQLALAAPTANHFRPFVSPEAQASPAVGKGDDVYALGSILYELLTGQKLPPAPPEGYDTVVDRATLANEGTALPPQVADLVKRSLAPAAQRIDDVTAWHKDISKILFEGTYNPTTFNLAFFMHNLFRDEIEKETEEIEAERTMEVPVQAAPEPVAEAAAPTSVLSTPSEDTGVFRDQYGLESEQAEKKRSGMIIGIIAAAVVVVVGGYLATRGGDESKQTETPVAAQPAAPTTAASDAATKALEEKMAQLDALITKQQEMVDSAEEKQADASSQDDARATQFEQELAALKSQLQAAEQEKEEVAKAAEEARKQEEVGEPLEVAADAGTAVDETAMDMAPETEGATDPASADQLTGDASTESTTPPPTQPPAAQTTPPKTAETKETTPRPAAQQPQAKPTPPPAKPKDTSGVKPGDLVQPGVGVVAPILQRPPRPRFPAMAKRLNKRATVEVSVLVSEKGRVLDARLKSSKKAGYGFDEAALQAAKDALYRPATKDGVPVKIWVELRIAFQ